MIAEKIRKFFGRGKDKEKYISLKKKYYLLYNMKYENGKLVKYDTVPICCATCKFNKQWPVPHTCDVCCMKDTPDYYMWSKCEVGND